MTIVHIANRDNIAVPGGRADIGAALAAAADQGDARPFIGACGGGRRFLRGGH